MGSTPGYSLSVGECSTRETLLRGMIIRVDLLIEIYCLVTKEKYSFSTRKSTALIFPLR
jgi:hypothetical protein